MASVSPNRSACTALVILVLLLATGTSLAASRDSRSSSSSRSVLPLGCWSARDGFIHNINFSTGIEEIAKPFCKAANGVGITVVKPICQAAKPPWSNKYQFTKGVTTFNCSSGQVCDQGICKVKPKSVGCYDSDAPGKSDTSTWGGWLDKYNPQLKTPGFVKTENIAGTPPNFVGDRCKDDNFMYEQICVNATSSSNFQQARKEVAVKCPTGYSCKNTPITDMSLAFGNPSAKGDGALTTAATCVPKPDPCDAPWNDMCPEIDECQKSPEECPPNKDICDSTLTKDQIQAKYGSEASIFPMVGGGWVADSCSNTDKIKHEWCDNGTPKSGISLCTAPDTCSKGLCGGKQVPPPSGGGKTTPDCEDTDIKGSTNSFGKPDVFGQIKLKGSVASAANDVCKTNKIVLQSKCDVGNAKGFSTTPLTCSGASICGDGVCFTAKKVVCADYSDAAGVHGVKGSDKKGNLFDKTDTCVSGNPDQIQKTACDETDLKGYVAKDPEFCPDGKTCKGNICVLKYQKTCGLLPGGNGIGVNENGKLTEYKNTCSGSIITSYECDASGNAVSKVNSCALGCNPTGLCESCKDDDTLNDPSKLGNIQWQEKGQTLGDKDFCDTTGKLVQVQCINNSKGYTQATPCPGNGTCQAGACKDLCAGKNLTSANKCQKGSCDPLSGDVTFKDWIICPASESCIPTTGNCTCNTKICPSGKTLNKQTCMCITPPPVCYGLICGANQTLDVSICKCVANKPDPAKDMTQQPCSPSNPNGKCTNIGDTCYNGACTKNLCATPEAKAEIAKTSGDLCKITMCNNGVVTAVAKPALDDKNICTKDTCVNGVFSHTPKCTLPETCNPTTGVCLDVNAPGYCIDDVKCDDKDTCNGVEKCSSNKCAVGISPIEGASPATDTACFDDDKDGITNKKDNCPKMYNPDQFDSNTNGKGDVCEVLLAAGNGHACASYLDGSLKCWGTNYYGQLGETNKGNSINYQPQQVAITAPSDPYTPKPLTNIISLSLSGDASCAVGGDNKPYCWGAAGPIQDPNNLTTNATGIAIGQAPHQYGNTYWNLACATLNSGNVTCWGNNSVGQLGDGTNSATIKPAQLVNTSSGVTMTDVSSVTATSPASDGFNCALLKNGQVKCWGNNIFGQLGNGKEENVQKSCSGSIVDAYPISVVTDATAQTQLTNVLTIASRNGRTCALLKDQTLHCWGVDQNSNGILGSKKSALSVDSCQSWQPSTTQTHTHVPLSVVMDPSSDTSPPLGNIITFALGETHSCAVTKDGAVYCWGCNNADFDIIPGVGKGCGVPPTKIKLDGTDISDAIQVAAGNQFTCIRKKDQGVKCWGANGYGQLMIPPYGVPSCVVQDPYSAPDCANPDGKKAPSSALVCDSYGSISCGQQYNSSNPNYKIMCPTPATATDNPTCVKIDFGTPTCLGPKDPYGNPTTKCSNDVGTVICDPYGNISCVGSAPWSNYKPTCSNDPNIPPTCKKPPNCGDEIIDAGEECDLGWNNGVNSICTQNCMKTNYGKPTCLVQDPYANPTCSGATVPGYSTKIVCDSNGQISCTMSLIPSSSPYSPKKCANTQDTPTCSMPDLPKDPYGCANNPNTKNGNCCNGTTPTCADPTMGKPICNIYSNVATCGGSADPTVLPTCPVSGGPVKCW